MRFRAPILVKLLAALVVPVVVLFALFAVVAFEVSRRDLDDELGRRLEAIASSASTQIRDGQYLAALGPRDVTEPLYQAVVARITTLAQKTGARLIVLDGKFDVRIDTDPNGLNLGGHYFHAELDRAEVHRVLDKGDVVSSVTFQDNGGTWYKTGYAPIAAGPNDPKPVLAIAAQAPASYFDRLSDLRGRLVRWGAGLALVSVIAAVLATLLITRNVRRLAAAAERIGGGDLHEPIAVRSRDELGTLAGAMDRMRVQLAERDAKMQQMLAGIAHEVRNPLAGMTLFAGLLRDELPEGPKGDEQRGHVSRIQRELGYLERVVNEFLDYARRSKPELAEVDVGELLDEIAQLAPSAAPADLAEPIEVAVTPTRERAFADRGQLRRAVLNLARNAVQAAAAADHHGTGAVTLSANRVGDELRISVWNRGAEIAPETSGKLFEPFFTTREQGTGLGLAFVRDIARDHGGRVEVDSKDGETTFIVILPTVS